MSQITSGLRAIFSSPLIYDGFQNLLGAAQIRRELVRDFIRPQPGMRVLDVGCGTAEVLDFLPADIAYFGYDISRPYIDAALKRFGSRGQFHCGIFDLAEAESLKGSFDLVTGFGLLHHLNDEEARALFSLARIALKSDGRMLTMDPCYVEGQNPIARYLIDHDRGQNVRAIDAYRALPGRNFEQVSGKLRYRSRIPYTEWIMECRV